jgi:hypothetical protein
MNMVACKGESNLERFFFPYSELVAHDDGSEGTRPLQEEEEQGGRDRSQRKEEHDGTEINELRAIFCSTGFYAFELPASFQSS